MTARQVVKRLLERTLCLALAEPRRMSGRALILAYHNVVPDTEPVRGDRSLHLSFGAFRRQLDVIQRHCVVQPLGEVLSGAPVPDGPQLAITFDDAYRGAVELALPELERRGLPSTLFVAPGLLGSRSFWWDELAGADGLAAEAREHALVHHGGRQVLIRADRPAFPTESLPESYGCVSPAQLLALGGRRRLTFGAHTWSHPNLARLSGEELVTELARPLDWLNASGLTTLPVLAYPYGLSSPGVEAAAAEAGYTAGLLIEGGWFAPPQLTKPFAVPRYNVPAGLSDDGLLLRLSGRLLP